MTLWYRADVGRHRHRKVRRLARELGVHVMHAAGIHDALCAMVAEAEADDGSLAGITAEDVATEVDFDGEPARLFEALSVSGIIEAGNDGLLLHGFAERSGVVISKSRADRMRLKESRVRRATLAGRSPDAPASVSVTYERTNVRDLTSGKPDGVCVEPTDYSAALQASIEQAKATKAEQLALVNPEHEGRPLGAFVDAWNRGTAGSPIPKAIAPGTRASARDKRLREATSRFTDPDEWFWCGKALAGDRHHRGQNDRGWVADLGWLLERGNGSKLEAWMARGAELRARGGRPAVVPVPTPSSHDPKDTTAAAQRAYRDEQQRRAEAERAKVREPVPLSALKVELPEFLRKGRDK